MWKGKRRRIYQKTKRGAFLKIQGEVESGKEPIEAKKIVFMLMSTSSKKTRGIIDDLCKIPEITERYILFGDYDIIVKIQTEDIDTMKMIMNRIASIGGVLSTKPLHTTPI